MWWGGNIARRGEIATWHELRPPSIPQRWLREGDGSLFGRVQLHQENGTHADTKSVAVLESLLANDRLSIQQDTAGTVLIDNHKSITIAADLRVLARDRWILDHDRVLIPASDRHDRCVEGIFATENRPTAPDQ